MEEKEALIQVEEPGANEIFFRGEHGSGFCEAFEGVNDFSLLAVGDSFVGEGFCCFVAHAKLFKTKKTFAGHLSRFFAQVQLKIDLRKIEIAKSNMVGVTRNFTFAAGRK